MPSSIRHRLDQLERGDATSLSMADGCLAAIADPLGEGRRAFVKCNIESARAAARAADDRRESKERLSKIDGLPLSIKDLFDHAGDVTTAGAKVLETDAPAAIHSNVVARLLQAGAVIVGRTNMTEFAYSGLGLNPHYGTPANPWDRPTRRI